MISTDETLHWSALAHHSP